MSPALVNKQNQKSTAMPVLYNETDWQVSETLDSQCTIWQSVVTGNSALSLQALTPSKLNIRAELFNDKNLIYTRKLIDKHLEYKYKSQFTTYTQSPSYSTWRHLKKYRVTFHLKLCL